LNSQNFQNSLESQNQIDESLLLTDL